MCGYPVHNLSQIFGNGDADFYKETLKMRIKGDSQS
jgi:hypothetical protein